MQYARGSPDSPGENHRHGISIVRLSNGVCGARRQCACQECIARRLGRFILYRSLLSYPPLLAFAGSPCRILLPSLPLSRFWNPARDSTWLLLCQALAMRARNRRDH